MLASLNEGFDFTDPDVVEKGVPIDELALLRRTSPVWWNEQPTGAACFGDTGYWVVSKHRDIKAVSRDSHLWSNHRNGTIIRFPDHMTSEMLDMTKTMILNQDAPAHTRLRKLISRLFTPRSVATLESKLAGAASRIVSEALEKGSGDFVDDVAVNLPLLAIADLIGVPEADRRQVFEWSNAMINTDDPDYKDDSESAFAEIMAYYYTMAEERRKKPADDIVTRLVQPDEDGESLDEIEFAFFVILLSVAGNETTRNATTHGMNAFFEYPDQWELFKNTRPVTAIDEIVRWSTPIVCFQRTALQDTELGGIAIDEGQRVGLFYSSGNFDEEVFDQPFKFDITRDPNPHLGFGGNGAHFCIGANLARMQMRLIFNEVADQMPRIEKAGEVTRLRSGWVNGIKKLPVRYAQ